MPSPKSKLTASSLFAGKEIQRAPEVLELSQIKENKAIHSFMMEPTIKRRLKEHFESKGLSWGAGLRSVIIEYMKREKLIR